MGRRGGPSICGDEHNLVGSGSRVYKWPSGAGKTEIPAEMEPVTTIGLGAVAAYVAKDGIGKLLGPTADYLGEGLRDLTRRRVESIGRIFSNASTKLGSQLDEPG